MGSKRNVIGLVFVASFSVFGLIFIISWLSNAGLEERAAIGENTPYYMEYAFDVSDKELLIGDADHLVIGKVKNKIDETKDEIGPITIFTVEIQKEWKGKLKSERISVAQRIGYDAVAEGIVKTDGDEYLKEGNYYVLVLKYDHVIKNYRITTPVFGNVLVKKRDDLTFNKAVIAEFEKAFENQRKPEY